ncbi:hypothetical protein RR48_02568 [Papilio machaon]|uniref:Uncharacterized protein n=1 Tax=Papilio machaon TaxID=76193 RepID=A0A0N1IHZ6_PAPMA|nr:hypothetical protein RR48_02568 [Papilio machaon]
MLLALYVIVAIVTISGKLNNYNIKNHPLDIRVKRDVQNNEYKIEENKAKEPNENILKKKEDSAYNNEAFKSDEVKSLHTNNITTEEENKNIDHFYPDNMKIKENDNSEYHQKESEIVGSDGVKSSPDIITITTDEENKNTGQLGDDLKRKENDTMYNQKEPEAVSSDKQSLTNANITKTEEENKITEQFNEDNTRSKENISKYRKEPEAANNDEGKSLKNTNIATNKEGDKSNIKFKEDGQMKNGEDKNHTPEYEKVIEEITDDVELLLNLIFSKKNDEKFDQNQQKTFNENSFTSEITEDKKENKKYLFIKSFYGSTNEERFNNKEVISFTSSPHELNERRTKQINKEITDLYEDSGVKDKEDFPSNSSNANKTLEESIAKQTIQKYDNEVVDQKFLWPFEKITETTYNRKKRNITFERINNNRNYYPNRNGSFRIFNNTWYVKPLNNTFNSSYHTNLDNYNRNRTPAIHYQPNMNNFGAKKLTDNRYYPNNYNNDYNQQNNRHNYYQPVNNPSYRPNNDPYRINTEQSSIPIYNNQNTGYRNYYNNNAYPINNYKNPYNINNPITSPNGLNFNNQYGYYPKLQTNPINQNEYNGKNSYENNLINSVTVTLTKNVPETTSSTSAPVILESCIFCRSVGCPSFFKRIGFLCVDPNKMK